MAELVRPKKPRPKERGDHSDVVVPQIPQRPTVVHGMRLPDVPRHSPAVVSRSRSVSPEPEELILSDDENEKSTVDRVVETRPSPVRPAPPPPQSETVVPPPLPPRNLVFPRSTSLQPTHDHTVESQLTSRTSLPKISTATRYPTLPELSDLPAYNSAIQLPPSYTQSVAEAAPLPPKTRTSVSSCVVAEAPPLYPSVSSLVVDRNEHGLLTEGSLLAFYHNPLYENVDEFSDRFDQTEEFPTESGQLFPLLKRMKELSDQMNISQVNEKENNESLIKCLHECWSTQQQFVDAKGKCGENRDGSGRASYQSAVFCQKRMDELRKLLSINRTNKLEHQISEEAQFRSLALQMQWEIIIINNHFMGENNLNIQSSPCLVESAAPTPPRLSLRRALSDLFYHLRFPRLSKRFTDAVVLWITELMCVLHMRCSSDDGLFVLSHLLRLPSPHSDWSAPLVQTFIQSQTSAKLKMDYCLALLAHMLNPIRAREKFLRHVAESEKEESSWAILSDENNDEMDEFSFVTISETDLIAIFDQLPMSEVYSLAYLTFSTSNQDKNAQFVSLVAFQLLLMKILDNGLSTYARPGYKLFCKQIGNGLRQSVRELCAHWRLIKDVLSPPEEAHLQKEVDRIMLLTLNYLVNRKSGGLWQFAVDLPYDSVSEECRVRCEFLLRSPKAININELYDTPFCEIQARCSSLTVQSRSSALDAQDSVFFVNSLASIIASSTTDATPFLKELVDICFCDESCRESLYKVGGEAIGQLLARRPTTLDQLLIIIDRNLQHMDNYAINVLASSRLLDCRLSLSILSVIGKWLNSPPDHGANRLARRVLSGLHWGPTQDGQTLWLDAEVHSVCADIVVKAHSVHCSKSNSMIAKSVRQITKLASKVGDGETLFQQFCWDLLIKLKLSHSDSSLNVKNDLTAYYVEIVQNFEESAQVYVEKAVPLLSELVQSGSSIACVVLLSRVIAQHYDKIDTFSSNKTFMDTFERLLHVDQLSYALQWLSGPSATPTPIVRLIASAISYYSTRVDRVREYLRAWTDLLCVKRTAWNEDQVTYQILDAIVRIALVNDPHKLYDITDLLQNAYTQQLASAKDASRGILSVFSSESVPPPLASSAMFPIAPYACYVLLLVEQRGFDVFYGHLFDALAKKEKVTLEAAVKKAAGKSSQALPLLRLSVFRWAEFVPHCNGSNVFPMVLQQLATEAFALRKGNKYTLCFARRLLDAPQASLVMQMCKTGLEQSKLETKGLTRAVSGWLYCQHEVTRVGFDFSVFDLDYLLQLILAGDRNVWLDYVNMSALSSEGYSEQKLYEITCHLDSKKKSISAFHPSEPTSPRQRSAAKAFPVLPTHSALPQAPSVEPSQLYQQHVVLQLAAPLLKTINSFANQYMTGSDKLASDDSVYCDLVKALYSPVQQTVPVQLSCGVRCGQPRDTTVQVQPYVFNATVDAQMSDNRNKRSAAHTELSALVIDKAAVAVASIEHIARQVARMASLTSSSYRDAVQLTGRSFFYLMTSSIGESELLFGAASNAYKHALRSLGEEFVRFRPEEQLAVMNLVLDGFVLSDPLVEVFTPEVLNAADLCNAYKQLSASVQLPQRSQQALKLLGRLGMEKAAAGLPAHQFSSLLPIAFANLASQPDPGAPLHILCHQHVTFFVFHQFPANLAAGLDLSLEGCNTNSTPVSLLHEFVDRLGAADFTGPSVDNRLGAAKASECIGIIARRLEDARQRLPAMYSVWARYFDPLSRLAQVFLYIPVRDSFSPAQQISILQKELFDSFSDVVRVFSPLIAPSASLQPPFSTSHSSDASLVFERFIELLNALPHNAAIPPGMQNIQSLVWQYYYERLSTLTIGAVYYYEIIERPLMRINWNLLWPSPRGLSAMEECLCSRSPHCASFVSQMVVRVPWSNLLAKQVSIEDRPNYLASLLAVLIRLAQREENYTSVRASLLDLCKQLSSRTDWPSVSAESTERLCAAVAVCLPADSVPCPVDIVSVIQIIWRKVCCFNPRDPYSTSTLLKQQMWLRTECGLLIKAPNAPAAYSSLIADVNTIATQHSNLRAFCVVTRELTALWKIIFDPQFGESMVSLWTEYLLANPTSPLLLTCMNTIIGSLNSDQLSTALKVLEKTLTAYFNRSNSSWVEVMEWVDFPSDSLADIQSYLLCIPTSENKVQVLPLTLRVFLNYGLHSDKIFFDLHNYVTNLKPKHVVAEPAFVLVIDRLVLWLANRAPSLPKTFSVTDDLLPPLLRWLNKSSRDDSGFFSNLISSKKTAFSPKFRVLLQILDLYLTQQSLGEGKRPRCTGDTAVLNSRIQTLKEAASLKANQSMSSAFNTSTAYFVQVDIHHISSAPRLLLSTARTMFNDRFFNET